MADYRSTCLRCGAQLEPNVAHPHSAPWRCPVCPYSYFVAELRDSARAAFRPERHDFAHSHAKAVREAVRDEVQEAMVRGTSLRHDQLGLVDAQRLRRLIKRGTLSPAFERAVRHAIRS